MLKSTRYQAIFATTLLLIFSIIVSCTRTPITRSTFALGAPLTIQILRGGSARAIDEAFEYAHYIERIMSTSSKDYDSSELLDINAQNAVLEPSEHGVYAASPETIEVVTESLEVSRKTDGAFDITVAPLVSLWGFDSGDYYVPSLSEIKKVRPFVNWNKVHVVSGSIELEAGQSIDVGGIAKGYAADKAADILKKYGVTHALIDFGGNIRTVGETKPDGNAWRIGIQVPFASIGTILATVHTGETSLVTSGVYERFFEESDIRYFHILDGSTGYPARNGLVSVTIIYDNGVHADGFSTGVFVLGLQRGMALVERIKGMEAIFITDAKCVYITSGLKDVFKLISEDHHMGLVP